MRTDKRFDTLVFIARCSPFHNGHKAVVKQALKLADKVVILLGSANSPRNTRDPWSFDDRKQMIMDTFFEANPGSSPAQRSGAASTGIIVIKPLPDYPYDDNKWKASVRTAVSGASPWSDKPPKTGLIGHSKDASSYYLGMFPDWEGVEVPNFEGINATDIREDYFHSYQPEPHGYPAEPSIWHNFIPEPVRTFMDKHPLPKTLIHEWELINRYKRAWEAAPFPPTFVTVDTVVVQGSHVLLVKRKAEPGIGLWALPGGFLNQDETLLNGAIRELKEETRIKVPERVLKRLAKTSKVFDAPHRSTRGRTLTAAFFIEFDDDGPLPKVTAADDAEKAVWVPFNEVDRSMLFEDHFHIIDYFTNIG
jgi:bifunctional NMN adenylyltransferase/nudix hydrolase